MGLHYIQYIHNECKAKANEIKRTEKLRQREEPVVAIQTLVMGPVVFIVPSDLMGDLDLKGVID